MEDRSRVRARRAEETAELARLTEDCRRACLRLERDDEVDALGEVTEAAARARLRSERQDDADDLAEETEKTARVGTRLDRDNATYELEEETKHDRRGQVPVRQQSDYDRCPRPDETLGEGVESAHYPYCLVGEQHFEAEEGRNYVRNSRRIPAGSRI